MSKNYYDTLGVQKGANKDEIKKAFYKLASKYHPDKKTGDEAKFKEINEAYQVLSDDTKKKEYDMYGQTFNGQAGPQGSGGFGGFGGSSPFGDMEGASFDFGDLGDIFGDMFGGQGFGGGQQRQKRGRDISIEIDISFEESIFGVERKVLLGKASTCKSCVGTGGEKGSAMITCKACNGNGKINETRKTFMGNFQTVTNCEVCRATGKVPEKKCHDCKGHGVKEGREEIAIAIPAGLNNGEMIRLSQMGEAISQGVTGDLYVKINVKPHPVWKRDHNDLIMTHSIKLSDALLGIKHSITGIDGDIAIDIPSGVSAGEILRIKNRGVPYLHENNKRGDVLVKLTIVMPKKLSKKAEALIKELKVEGL